jgi:hypothetical protein
VVMRQDLRNYSQLPKLGLALLRTEPSRRDSNRWPVPLCSGAILPREGK